MYLQETDVFYLGQRGSGSNQILGYQKGKKDFRNLNFYTTIYSIMLLSISRENFSENFSISKECWTDLE